jgi:hypothetical protein
MGHLTRQLAVGLAAMPDARVTLFSLSVGLPTVTGLGVPGEYAPGPERGWIPESEWAHYLAGRIEALGNAVDANVVVFDGVAPYRGVTLARDRLRKTKFAWFRRGMWRPRTNAGQLWKSGLFDLVIEPGDLAAKADRGPTANLDDAVVVQPVSLFEVVDRLDRREAATELGLHPERPSILLNLGTGRLGEVVGPGKAILNEILRHEQWQVCVITSAVAETSIPQNDSPRVIQIRGVFPLVRYLNAFDCVVSAAGYNAVHEYIPAGLPTLLVPNRLTRTDDQIGRAHQLAQSGLALAAPSDSADYLEASVRKLLDPSIRAELTSTIGNLPSESKTGGAAQTAATLTELANESSRSIPVGAQMRRARDNAKQSIKGLIGTDATNRVRRVLGRPPLPTGKRMRVAIDQNPSQNDVHRLHIATDPDVELLLGADPVEHLLAGTSGSYKAARRLLIDRSYDVVS